MIGPERARDRRSRAWVPVCALPRPRSARYGYAREFFHDLIRLESEVKGPGRIVDIVREQTGMGEPYAHTYTAGAIALQTADRAEEAITLLREGIGKVGPQQNLFALYQAAGELLDRSGETEAAVMLLREGIAKIGPQQGLFALYQAAGWIFGRHGRTQDAVRILREGLRAIPKGRSGNRYQLGLSLLYLHYAARDKAALEEAIHCTGDDGLDPQQQALGRVLLLELATDWAGAAATAARARDGFPILLDLAAREAFARLCVGEPAQAEAALDRFPWRQEIGPGDPLAWLQAFIALQGGDLPKAQERLSLFLGVSSVDGDAAALRERLLRAWDESPDNTHAQILAYYFPHLPPILTGFTEDITRRQAGPSALAPDQAIDTTAPRTGDKDRPSLAILAICTEWSSRHGGVSTFNRDLCLALQRAGQQVVCLVMDKTAEEEEHARGHGITLIAAPDLSVPDADAKARLYLPAPVPDGFRPQVIIGHDHVTGIAARVQTEHHFPDAARVHFIHTAPGEIEWFKSQPGTTAAAKAERKEQGQLKLSSSAQLVVAVGPRLYGEIGTRLQGLPDHPPLHRLDPGILCPEAPREPPPLAQCLLLGRTEDAELKGLDIAARALGLMVGDRPRLILRGAGPGEGDNLRRWLLEQAASPGLDIRTREYVADAERLTQDLRSASLLLMPSRREGFGLVGIEALAAGTPILISENSGLAALIREHCKPDVAKQCIVPVIDDLDTDAQTWERNISFIMRDRPAAFRNARELAETLAQTLTWDRAVQGLLEALDSARSGQ